MAISHWPAAERPRERLIALGAKVLSDAELIALFLRTGIKGKSAVELARDLLAGFGGLAGLLSADQAALRKVKGLGAAKYAQLAAVLELSRRALGEELRSRSALTSPQSVRDYLRLSLGTRLSYCQIFSYTQSKFGTTTDSFLACSVVVAYKLSLFT